MDYIDIFRGSGYGSQGDWWSPNLRHSEMYKHGPLAGKMSKSKISLEDFKKGVERANTKHKATRRYLEKIKPLQFKSNDLTKNFKDPLGSKVLPSAVELRKQFDIDYKKMPFDKFKIKYHEAILPNQPSKIALGNTIKPLAMNPKRVLGELKPKHAKVLGKAALGQAARFAGPLGIAYGVYDYLSGSPAGEGSDNIKGAKPFNGILKKKKKR